MLIAIAVLPAAARAEQASQPHSSTAGELDAGQNHSCAILTGGALRCWGYGAHGQLGYASTRTIGDNETPGSVGPLDLGPGRTATAISAGGFHTCALLDDETVRCWGYGADGRLGYANTQTVGDDETPGSAGSVDLGAGRSARAITAGLGHSCAILDDGNVRCWGYGQNGALGYGNAASVGDDEAPGSVAPVYLGEGRTAKAISAGNDFTCAVLDDGSVKCWGLAVAGRLGYGNTDRVGDDESPGSVGSVELGLGRRAVAISAGPNGACALLDDQSVRCWGEGRQGALGYGTQFAIGDDETPGSVGPVDIGPGRTAAAISAGRHTCALLDLGDVRCWGPNTRGQLGYVHTTTIGDTETPGSFGPVDLGGGRRATAISAGELHTCARLDDGSVRCWGYGGNGRLGLCNERNVGDDETPASVPTVPLTDAACPRIESPPQAAPSGPRVSGGADALARALRAQATRRRGLRSCLSRARRHRRLELRRARGVPSGRGRRLKRHAKRHFVQQRRRCSKRWGRRPGRVTALRARALSRTRVLLSFRAAGTDGSRLPAAHTYVVKQSRSPIRTRRDFRRAAALCGGRCRFPAVARIGAELSLTVTDLRARRRYYYAIAARDNVSRLIGPPTRAVSVRTR